MAVPRQPLEALLCFETLSLTETSYQNLKVSALEKVAAYKWRCTVLGSSQYLWGNGQ
jgi:hypothetical protein